MSIKDILNHTQRTIENNISFAVSLFEGKSPNKALLQSSGLLFAAGLLGGNCITLFTTRELSPLAHAFVLGGWIPATLAVKMLASKIMESPGIKTALCSVFAGYGASYLTAKLLGFSVSSIDPLIGCGVLFLTVATVVIVTSGLFIITFVASSVIEDKQKYKEHYNFGDTAGKLTLHSDELFTYLHKLSNSITSFFEAAKANENQEGGNSKDRDFVVEPPPQSGGGYPSSMTPGGYPTSAPYSGGSYNNSYDRR